MNIICFLTVRPCELFYTFCKQLKSEKYDIYICIDDNDYTIPNYDSEINILKINNKVCQDEGFKNTVTYCVDKACSRDKALYYFCKNDHIDFQYIWFLEEDVFIPTISTIINIDKKYVVSDLLSSSHVVCYNQLQSGVWATHWDRIIHECKLKLPYCFSMICAIRCSKKMLMCINQYATEYKSLFFYEALFNTIAFLNNLVIINPPELSTIVYRNNYNKYNINKNNLYHPIKSIKTQYEYREFLSSSFNGKQYNY